MSTVAVPLSQGYVAIVDAADATRVLAHKWSAEPKRKTVYAVRQVQRPDGGWVKQRLHTFLTGYAQTDHANGDGLDNRRANLREATATQNNQNRRRRSDNTSGFKGVMWRKDRSQWRAHIMVSGRQRSLGAYASAEEAARAYDAAAREFFGEYAALNFPEHGERAA